MAATVLLSSSFTLVPLPKRSPIGGGPSSPLEPKPVKSHHMSIDFNGASSGQSQTLKLAQQPLLPPRRIMQGRIQTCSMDPLARTKTWPTIGVCFAQNWSPYMSNSESFCLQSRGAMQTSNHMDDQGMKMSWTSSVCKAEVDWEPVPAIGAPGKTWSKIVVSTCRLLTPKGLSFLGLYLLQSAT